ncbi:SDR family NAD(P)-dependent oxidoreductase [Rathayibacter tanaceti]|uniref:SDR family NAD(P)-dependent oxidoreductase n=2 Tax=Rathayibacter tanaceti TaxID=1671680 RepID=A0A162GTX2_9MICO|nr:SDR family NAD(P)-dependent oxidoreductase [Rathayibacter tanaceti]KZX22558.1 Serine 3-dehydrogenase [Rathayibacter tanaceti]QHC54765.1 SDR family NAD(P)-dependent oxidoreductase [Rathayibacter tanaceti]TCO37415.1 short-subunit dehydrogenase [Rathayibacter tanaceti]
MTTSPEAVELILVTGASTGMGAATVRELAARGYHVLAGVRRESDGRAIAAPRIQPVLLDITRPEQIQEVAALIETDGRPLRAVVNNAGIAVNAPVEVLPMQEWRRQFDVNFFGHIEVTQAVLPALLRSRGRVVMISSIGGRLAQPTYGAYSGSKFALEAVADSLRRELAPTGVQVAIVEPGAVRTEMVGRGGVTLKKLSSEMSAEQERRYGGLMKAILLQSEGFLRSGVDASQAARTIAAAATERRPKTRYTIGRDAAILIRLARFLPDRVLDRLLASSLRGLLRKVQ